MTERSEELGVNQEGSTARTEAPASRRPCDTCGELMEEGNDTADLCDACAQKFQWRIANMRTHCFFCGHSLNITDTPRPPANNVQWEPPYPNHETAIVSIRYPYHTAHKPTELCAIQTPHLIEDCGEFER